MEVVKNLKDLELVYSKVDTLCTDIAYSICIYKEERTADGGYPYSYAVALPSEVVQDVLTYMNRTYNIEFEKVKKRTFKLLNGLIIKEDKKLLGKNFKIVKI